MSNSLNKTSNGFKATIKIDTSVNAPTVLYAMTQGRGDAWYPNGYNFDITDAQGNDIQVTAE